MTSPTLDGIAAAMIAAVPDEALVDLRTEDPAVAVEVHFDPVRVRSLPVRVPDGDCSTDGFYEPAGFFPVPTILFDDEAAAVRQRFTILHELGHHLLVTTVAHLLDDLDQIAGNQGALRVEEAACHRFAGAILIPDALLRDTLAEGPLRPRHIVDLHDQCDVSWETAAIRAAGAQQTKSAVALIRTRGRIDFCAASTRLGWGWWPRGSHVQHGGPLDRALASPQTARPEIYRYRLTQQHHLYCDTLKVHDGLAIAVLSDRPSDGHFDIPEEVEPEWKSREEFCEFCGAERTIGWCDICRGRRCCDCGRCGCAKPIDHDACPECQLKLPRAEGSLLCVDCVADGLG